MMEYAAFQGNAVELRIQAEAGASRGHALRTAAMRGHLACVEILVGIETSPAELESGILQAGIFEHRACVEAIARAPLLDRDNVLVEAALTGNILVVRALAPLPCGSGTVRRAMTEAASYGHAECLEVLLDHTTEEIERRLAILQACLRGQAGCVRVLMPRVSAASRGDALLEALVNDRTAAETRDSVLRAVLACDLPMEIRTRTEWCADPLVFGLLLASQSADAAVAVLLAKGVDPNARALVISNTEPRLMPTPLMIAATEGHAPTVEMLLEAGADRGADQTDDRGKTAIMLAAERGHVDCVRALAAIATPSHVCTSTASAFGLARENGHQNCIDEMYRGMRLNEKVLQRLGRK